MFHVKPPGPAPLRAAPGCRNPHEASVHPSPRTRRRSSHGLGMGEWRVLWRVAGFGLAARWSCPGFPACRGRREARADPQAVFGWPTRRGPFPQSGSRKPPDGARKSRVYSVVSSGACRPSWPLPPLICGRRHEGDVWASFPGAAPRKASEAGQRETAVDHGHGYGSRRCRVPPMRGGGRIILVLRDLRSRAVLRVAPALGSWETHDEAALPWGLDGAA
jgi:hypothetical protein